MDEIDVTCEAKYNPSQIEPHIIILDDDDFIQTTLNLFNQHHSHANTTPVSNFNPVVTSPVLFSSSMTQVNQTQTHQQQNQNSDSNNILIDLTCDDFDLNDIFFMSTKNQFTSSSAEKKPDVSNELIKTDKVLVKSELISIDFNLNNFNSCYEEILIDDDDDENYDSNDSEENYGSYEITNQNLDSSDQSSTSASNGGKALKCENCLKTFNKLYNYKRHMFLHLTKDGLQPTASNDVTAFDGFDVNTCPKCERKILDRSNFKKHLRICCKNDTSIDLSEFETVRKSRQHTLSKIKTEKSIKLFANHLRSKKFQCEICKKVFNKKFNFHRHLRLHFLNETMHNRGQINQHVTNNNDSQDFYNKVKLEYHECEKCSRKFNEQKQFLRHMQKWHLTEYTCEYCVENNQFKEKLDYIRHLNMQHGHRLKFVCNFCQKSFQYMSQYVQHRQSHLLNNSRMGSASEQTDFSEMNASLNTICEVCYKCFSKPANLKRHLKDVDYQISLDLAT